MIFDVVSQKCFQLADVVLDDNVVDRAPHCIEMFLAQRTSGILELFEDH